MCEAFADLHGSNAVAAVTTVAPQKYVGRLM